MSQEHLAAKKIEGTTEEPAPQLPPVKDFISRWIFGFFVTEDEAGTEQTDGSDPEFDAFIQQIVIPNSEDQRTRWQFATLMLLSASETQDRQNFRYKPSNRQGGPLVNQNSPFSPNSDRFNNYIIACPDEGGRDTIHAERVIFEQFDQLWKAYRQSNQRFPVSIVLYTWIMPCTRCTDWIIQKLSKIGVPVTVAYTLPAWDKEPKETADMSRQRLRDSGITVEDVVCPYRLPRKH